MTDARETDAPESDLIELDDLAAAEERLFEDEDRTFPERPCGDPAAHDRLLAALRRHHPDGHDKAADAGAPMSRWRPSVLDISLTGSSAGLCADAA